LKFYEKLDSRSVSRYKHPEIDALVNIANALCQSAPSSAETSEPSVEIPAITAHPALEIFF
jgi:hypothetical protein